MSWVWLEPQVRRVDGENSRYSNMGCTIQYAVPDTLLIASGIVEVLVSSMHALRGRTHAPNSANSTLNNMAACIRLLSQS
mmetsp:Transcript_51105/g.121425  ORF Transcript_51105/g.121425 Transcript_51105/m.121425 type:complete len:80 (+) Transcript_51105:1289-1528(+)